MTAYTSFEAQNVASNTSFVRDLGTGVTPSPIAVMSAYRRGSCPRLGVLYGTVIVDD